MRKLISYPLNTADHGWPGAPTLRLEPFESMAKGDPLNTYKIEIFNHFGSHMDAPRHFNPRGASISELPLDTFFFERPLLLDIPKSFKEKVVPEDILPHADALRRADLLMIRSGFSRVRRSDNARYASEGPAVRSDTSRLLVSEFGNLKAIALDWISLGSASDCDDAILSHQHILGHFGDKSICVIEDLDFEGLDARSLRRVMALPLWVQGIDSAAVTVVAELA